MVSFFNGSAVTFFHPVFVNSIIHKSVVSIIDDFGQLALCLSIFGRSAGTRAQLRQLILTTWQLDNLTTWQLILTTSQLILTGPGMGAVLTETNGAG